MFRIVTAAGIAVAITVAGYSKSVLSFAATAETNNEPKVARVYGKATKVGNGIVRSYVLYDARDRTVPREIGVALSEGAMDSLPSSGAGHHDGHMETHEFLIDLPQGHNTPFKFVEMNWNPAGHEPEGVYLNVPHFDFHFYTVSKAERDAIMPSDPEFANKANNVPTGDYVPPMTAPLGPPGVPPAGVAVPMMGVHWVDLRSHELQGILGKPEAFKPFDATFIYGSWNGQYHFLEPMITRAHLLARKNAANVADRDQRLEISVPAKYQKPGYYPVAYRILWDADAKEYRVALTELTKR